jgi:hypothetical protein
MRFGSVVAKRISKSRESFWRYITRDKHVEKSLKAFSERRRIRNWTRGAGAPAVVLGRSAMPTYEYGILPLRNVSMTLRHLMS